MNGIAMVPVSGKIVIMLGKFRFFGGPAGQAHNLEVTGSNPVPAIHITPGPRERGCGGFVVLGEVIWI
jgi:hypothetical protein